MTLTLKIVHCGQEKGWLSLHGNACFLAESFANGVTVELL
jgi:hypothetical protein